MNRIYILFVACAFTACATTEKASVADSEPHAILLTEAFWADAPKHDPKYRVLEVDGVPPEGTFSVFTYTDRYRLSPGTHRIEYECNNRKGKRRLAQVEMSAGRVYFLVLSTGRRLIERRPTGRICPGGLVNPPLDDPRCTFTYEEIYENTCEASVGEIGAEQIQQLKTWNRDWESMGVNLMRREDLQQ